MKKILLAVDGPQFSAGAQNTLHFLASKMDISVTGAFLENVFKYKMGKMLHDADNPEADVVEEYDAYMDKTVRSFEQFCTNEKIDHEIHEIAEGYNQDTLLLETRFADLMIISSERFFHYEEDVELNPFVQKLLKHTECPVLVIPESFQSIESIILTFDSSASSAYAIKQFAYLFPDLLSLPATLAAGVDDKDANKSSFELVENWGKAHFSNFSILKLSQLGPDQVEEYAENKNKAVVVTGSFGRSDVSMTWKGSFSQHIICRHKVPVFIAHK